MRKFIPIEDRVVIKTQKTVDSITPSGLTVPGEMVEKPMEGEVVAVGPGRVTLQGVHIKPTVKIGDTVIFGNSQYGYSEMSDGIDTYLIIRESELLTIVEDTDAGTKTD